MNWTPENKVTDCGQLVNVVTNSGTSGEVDLDLASTVLAIVKSIDPQSGSIAGGNTVTITGSGFTGAIAVNFGSIVASFVIVSDSQITATSPASNVSGAVDVTMVTPYSTSDTSMADQFTYM